MMSRSLQLGLALSAAALCVHPLVAAAGQGDWLIRGGIGVVDPTSDNLDLGSLGALEVDTGTSLTIEAAYLFTEHLAVELLVAYPFTHDVDLGGAGTIAEATHLPPTLSLQYHFNPMGGFRPYVGAGLNYTTFMHEKVRGDTLGSLGLSDPKLDDSWGAALQLGTDFDLGGNWFLNLVVRWIDIDSDLELTDEDGAAVNLGEVEIDPFVYQAQVGYRFGRHPAP